MRPAVQEEPTVPRRTHAAVAVAAAALAGVARGQTTPMRTRPVMTGLAYSLGMAFAPGDPTRLFVVEQRRGVRVIHANPDGTYTLVQTPFIDLTGQNLNTGLEYGALSVLFHPQYRTNGFVYVVYSPTSASGNFGDWLLARYHVDPSNPDQAEPNSRTTVLFLPYPIQNHRAGWMAFGPDGYLYANTGDGGEGDPGNRASNLGLLFGKTLRLDVNGPDGIPGTSDDDAFPADPNKNYCIPGDNPFISTPGALAEIWAYGLRNPWRSSFDRLTGDLWTADVGQSAWEEVDFQPASSPGGIFYGWRCLEAAQPTNYAGCPAQLPPSTLPVFAYPHSGGGITGSSVTGGYVYRGCAMPAMQGRYFFGDWTGKIWSALPSGGTLTNIVAHTAELTPAGQSGLGTMVSFAEDHLGELYYVAWGAATGAVHKIEPQTPQGPDCNANGRTDACDIALGVSLDQNHDGVPDECQGCYPNCDGSTAPPVLNVLDFNCFINSFSSGESYANCDGSTTPPALNVLDFNCFLNRFAAGCP
jgi:glucose/arabinose dehydrogenase